MLRHAQTGSPLFCEVGANAHRRVPLTCTTFPWPKPVQRRGFHAGLLGENQLAGSVALKAMAPLMTDGAETQSAGPAGEFAKLKVCFVWHTCQCLSTAKDTRLSAGCMGVWHAQLDDETDGEVIYVPDAFNAEPGVLLTNDLLIGKELAGGAQVRLLTEGTVLHD